MTTYTEFLERKRDCGGDHGFEPLWMPDFLFPFQRALTTWALRKGRAALFADCGMGKTLMQLVWAWNVVLKTGGRVLILTPLAVGRQTLAEAAKFGIDAARSKDGTLHPGINITNYERLHYFNPSDFVGVVADESSIIKHNTGATQKALTRFTLKLPYRLLCTATAAPNDYIELGTSSEALGDLSHTDMLTRFFSASERTPYRLTDVKEAIAKKSNHFAKLAFRVSQTIDQWHLKPYAELHFWKWVCSWARACRKPSDVGFDDDRFELPPLIENHHIVKARSLPEGCLFPRVAIGLSEEREERRRTLTERCEYVAELASRHPQTIAWCHLNDEGDMLEKMLPNARQVKGSTPEEEREEIYDAFTSGQIEDLVIKPRVGAWGMNFQNCAHVVTFASHSYEQYYQSIRRCWRFGQKQPVTVDVVSTEGEAAISDNMRRKADSAAKMFDLLVAHMNDALKIERTNVTKNQELPAWLSKIS